MKIDRAKVHEKCGGRCGYCGKSLVIKEMQVDHIYPKCNGGSDEFENLMPSCRQCNHYKRADTLPSFRLTMRGLHERVAKIYIHKVAVNFGMAVINPWDGLFYFERIGLIVPELTQKRNL